MTSDSKALLDKALQLSESERAELAALLFRSIDGPVEEGVEEAWNEEIARRIHEIDLGQVEMIPWGRAKRMIFGDPDES